MTKEGNELVPVIQACPFCGGEAKLSSALIEASVYCVACGAGITEPHGAKLNDKTGDRKAITAWNTRTSSTAELLEALERIARGRKPEPRHPDDEGCLCHVCAEEAGALRSIAQTAIAKFGGGAS